MSVSPFQQANQLLREGKLEEAVVAYQQAIKHNPQFYGTYQNLGETLGKLGKLDEAVEMYRKAIELKPLASWLHQDLRLLLEKSGKKEEAIHVHPQVVKIEPGLVEMQVQLEKNSVASHKKRTKGTMIKNEASLQSPPWVKAINSLDEFFSFVNVSLLTNSDWLVNLVTYYEEHYRNYSISNQVAHDDKPSGFNLTKFLEAEFKKDPSRFDITLALALNYLNIGNQNRGIQLLKRVSNSRYKEHWLAQKCLELIMQ